MLTTCKRREPANKAKHPPAWRVSKDEQMIMLADSPVFVTDEQDVLGYPAENQAPTRRAAFDYVGRIVGFAGVGNTGQVASYMVEDVVRLRFDERLDRIGETGHRV